VEAAGFVFQGDEGRREKGYVRWTRHRYGCLSQVPEHWDREWMLVVRIWTCLDIWH
jgi:hypothetical protein